MNGKHGRQKEGRMRVAKPCGFNAAERTEGKPSTFKRVPVCVCVNQKIPSVPSGKRNEAANIGQDAGKKAETRSKVLSLPSDAAVKALEAEYDCPFADTVRGFFTDGEDIASTAQILGLRPLELRAWCDANMVQWRRVRRIRTMRGVPRPRRVREKIAATKTRTMGCGWFEGRKVSSSYLASISGLSERTIRYRVSMGVPAAEAIRIEPSHANHWRRK